MCATFILLELQKTSNAPGKLWKCVKEGCTRLIFCRYLDCEIMVLSFFFFTFQEAGGGAHLCKLAPPGTRKQLLSPA